MQSGCSSAVQRSAPSGTWSAPLPPPVIRWKASTILLQRNAASIRNFTALAPCTRITLTWRETNRIIRLGLHGIKLHPDFQRFDIDSPGAYKIYEQIAGRLPVLIHMGDDRYAYSKPERLARVMRDFPTLRVMASHLGGYRCWEEARECLRGNANIRFDTSSSLPMLDPAYARKLIEHYGVENCMFGTDFPCGSQRRSLHDL